MFIRRGVIGISRSFVIRPIISTFWRGLWPEPLQNLGLPTLNRVGQWDVHVELQTILKPTRSSTQNDFGEGGGQENLGLVRKY